MINAKSIRFAVCASESLFFRVTARLIAYARTELRLKCTDSRVVVFFLLLQFWSECKIDVVAAWLELFSIME